MSDALTFLPWLKAPPGPPARGFFIVSGLAVAGER
jgi:hypothetical protein